MLQFVVHAHIQLPWRTRASMASIGIFVQFCSQPTHALCGDRTLHNNKCDQYGDIRVLFALKIADISRRYQTMCIYNSASDQRTHQMHVNMFNILAIYLITSADTKSERYRWMYYSGLLRERLRATHILHKYSVVVLGEFIERIQMISSTSILCVVDVDVTHQCQLPTAKTTILRDHWPHIQNKITTLVQRALTHR